MALDPKWQNPYSPYKVIGKPHTIAQTASRNVYLFCKGNEIDGWVIRAEVQDMEAKDERGYPIPPIIVIPCPRCDKGLKIDGIAKGVTVQYLDTPKPLDLRHAGFGLVEQTAVVSVREDMTCPYFGDGSPCGFHFRITENVLHKVG